jgi:hypothetical protein
MSLGGERRLFPSTEKPHKPTLQELSRAFDVLAAVESTLPGLSIFKQADDENYQNFW